MLILNISGDLGKELKNLITMMDQEDIGASILKTSHSTVKEASV